MFDNKRKSVRRTLIWEAAIIASDGTWQHRCTILDVSQTGAKLSIDPEISLPGEFFLSLTESGRVGRPCCLVWRTDDKVGVRFTHGAHGAEFGRPLN
jgi:hypothetical protein